MNLRGASSLITAKPASVFARGLLFIFPALHWRVVHRSIRRVLSAGLRIHRSSSQWVAEPRIYIASGHAVDLPCFGTSAAATNRHSAFFFRRILSFQWSPPLLTKVQVSLPDVTLTSVSQDQDFPHYRSHHRWPCTKHSVRQTCRMSIFEACFLLVYSVRYDTAFLQPSANSFGTLCVVKEDGEIEHLPPSRRLLCSYFVGWEPNWTWDGFEIGAPFIHFREKGWIHTYKKMEACQYRIACQREVQRIKDCQKEVQRVSTLQSSLAIFLSRMRAEKWIVQENKRKIWE